MHQRPDKDVLVAKLDILVNNAATNPHFGPLLSAALYLASPASSFTTGTVLLVDGGQMAGLDLF